MIVKKTAGRVIGGHLTNAEQKAMEIEIQKSIAEFDRKNEIEVDAMFLWIIRKKLGLGEKKLHEIFTSAVQEFDNMMNRYELETGDRLWIFVKLLKDEGIDIEQWYKEVKNL